METEKNVPNPLPPAVIFLDPRRIWRLALQVAWDDLQRTARNVPPLPRIFVAPSAERLEQLLEHRPASFVILSGRHQASLACLEQVPLWLRRFPDATFAVTDVRQPELTPLLWELGVRCVIGSPRQVKPLVLWLAWHLQKHEGSPAQWQEAVWDRLPWTQWSTRSRFSETS